MADDTQVEHVPADQVEVMDTGWANRIVDGTIHLVPPDQLLANPLNARRHPGAQRDTLREALDQLGWIALIMVNIRTGHLIDGHARVEEALSKGAPHVPVYYVDLSEEEERIALATLDPISAMATYDPAILDDLLADLNLGDGPLAKMLAELDAAWPVTDGGAPAPLLTDPDDLPEPPTPTTKSGDVWVCGPHRVMCGDSTNTEHIATLMAGGKADMVWTDPPYGVGYTAKNAMLNKQDGGNRLETGIESDELDGEALVTFLRAGLTPALGASRPGASWWVAAPGMAQPLRAFAVVLCELDVWRNTLVWVKDGFVLGRSDYHGRHEQLLYGWAPGGPHTPPPNRSQDSVWEFPRPRKNDLHPTMKPVALIERAVSNHTGHGDVVLDVFGGSGSTLIAAHTLGRQARLMELDKVYVDVICRRFQEATGIVPVLESTGAPHDFTT
jgi:DNA modification methylase